MAKPEADTVKLARKQLGLTQNALAQALGISGKAIQSYEQGWREVPGRVMMQLLVLVSVHRRNAEGEPPCWEVRGCSQEEREHCPSYTIGNGRFCWFITANMVRGGIDDASPEPSPCLVCPVVRSLLGSNEKAQEAAVVTGRNLYA